MEKKNKLDGVIGTNGVVFGKGYKGKGMCKNCAFSTSKQFYAGGPTNLLCGYYAAQARSVSRNCAGIRSLKTEE